MIGVESIKYKTKAAVDMLIKMISIPSVTFDEEKVADFLYEYLTNGEVICYLNLLGLDIEKW